MRRCLLLFVVVMLARLSPGQTAPATLPASETLAHGAIEFTPPPISELIGKRGDDLSAGYAIAVDAGQIVITVAPQPQPIPDRLSSQFASQIQQAIRDEAAKGTIQTVTPPKVEPDKRFFLRIHDQFRLGGKFSDRLQLFRSVGSNLVSVTINSFHDDAKITKQIQEMGENVTLSVRIKLQIAARPGPAQPVVYSESRLRVVPPAGWTSEPTHQPTGLIVTWRDPTDQTNLIVMTYRTIPPNVNDPKLRDLAIEQTAAGEKPTFQASGAKADGTMQTVSDKRFLRKTRMNYLVDKTKVRVSFRQVRAGDGVVSITSVALQDKAEQIESVADQAALDTRAVR